MVESEEMTRRNIAFVTIVGVFLFLSTIFTSLRCYVRFRTSRKLRADDWFMIGAYMCFTWYSICAFIKTITVSQGRHRWDLADERAETGYKLWYSGLLAYGFTTLFARHSIGLFFMRITNQLYHRLAIYLSMFGNASIGFIFIGVIAFNCQPVNYWWERAYPHNVGDGRCMDELLFVRLAFTYSTIAAFCDLIYFFLPFHILWTATNMSTRTKLTLAPLLALAGLGGISPLIRMPHLPTLSSPDFFYDTYFVAIWSTVEMGIAVSCGSLVTLRPMLKRFKPKNSSHQLCPMHSSRRRQWRIYGSDTSWGGFERGADRMWARFQAGGRSPEAAVADGPGATSPPSRQHFQHAHNDDAIPPRNDVLANTTCRICLLERANSPANHKPHTKVRDKVEVDWRHFSQNSETDDIEEQIHAASTQVAESWTKYWDAGPGLTGVPKSMTRQDLGLSTIDSYESISPVEDVERNANRGVEGTDDSGMEKEKWREQDTRISAKSIESAPSNSKDEIKEDKI